VRDWGSVSDADASKRTVAICSYEGGTAQSVGVAVVNGLQLLRERPLVMMTAAGGCFIGTPDSAQQHRLRRDRQREHDRQDSGSKHGIPVSLKARRRPRAGAHRSAIRANRSVDHARPFGDFTERRGILPSASRFTSLALALRAGPATAVLLLAGLWPRTAIGRSLVLLESPGAASGTRSHRRDPVVQRNWRGSADCWRALRSLHAGGGR
jgi:hypothetical protein